MGCGEQSKFATASLTQSPGSQIPETYVNMLDQLNQGNLNMVKQYGDLTIANFKNSKYIFNAEVMDNLVESSKMLVTNRKVNYIADGISNMDSSNSQKDINTVKLYLEELNKQRFDENKSFDQSIQYILTHFNDSSNIKINIPLPPDSLSPPSSSDFEGLSWFANVGYPVPTENDMTIDESQNELKAFYYLTNGFSEDKFSYTQYFYIMSSQIEDKSIKKQLLNKVISLTKNDKYNQYRLEAQNDLQNL